MVASAQAPNLGELGEDAAGALGFATSNVAETRAAPEFEATQQQLTQTASVQFGLEAAKRQLTQTASLQSELAAAKQRLTQTATRQSALEAAKQQLAQASED